MLHPAQIPFSIYFGPFNLPVPLCQDRCRMPMTGFVWTRVGLERPWISGASWPARWRINL